MGFGVWGVGIRGPQYGPQNSIILLLGTPNKVSRILGNYHIGLIGDALGVYRLYRGQGLELRP